MPRHSAFILALAAALILAGCHHSAGAGKPASQVTYAEFTRSDFNRRAAEQFLPLFWRADSNHDNTLQPDELAVLWGFGDGDPSHWVNEGKFTPLFEQAYRAMRQPEPVAAGNGSGDTQRHAAVLAELAQGRTVLVSTSLSKDSAAEAAMVRHLLSAAQSIERLYARQKGVAGMAAKIPPDDRASLMLFHRNQSPFCEAPNTENDPACSALARKPAHTVGLYPPGIQSNDQFCELLAKQTNAKQLMDHFSVVVSDTGNNFKAIPYSEAYKEDMQAVAMELDAAAKELGDEEAAFKHYLSAAAQAFRDNEWEPADRAWVAMNATNSKWYARIAPDEVYYEPCAWKAGFALQLARINPDSLVWQKRLEPLKNEMEQTLARMAGPPYRARTVQFKLPDFINVVVNAGDQRNAHGATIGQSLPNWGPVAAAGGRTVAMTNLYTDADSQAQQTKLDASLFCAATFTKSSGDDSKQTLITSLLHEAAHNLGPAHEYQVNGQVDSVAFGGPLAATLEELKAQNSSLFLTNWLAAKGLFTAREVDEIQLNNVGWAFGHIARGMYDSNNKPRNYSQLAAIQVGSFMADGAISWQADELAANGSDKGCMAIDFAKLPAAIQALEITVLKIKASNDKAQAEQLKARYVDDQDDAYAQLKATIKQRWLRAPKATFVYSVSD